MAVLFLDPLLLGVLLGVAGYCGAVWLGRFVRWFGRPEGWTAMAWPLPALVLLVPVLGGGVLALLRVVGLEPRTGSVGAAAAYAMVYLAPAVGLAVWPPRWLLPPWARERLASLPAAVPDAPTGAMPAASGRRGHGSRATWVWRVDAVAGWVWLDEGFLRFRGTGGDLPGQAAGAVDLDDEAIAELRFSDEGELRLEPPRGGWWSRTQADVDLAQIDRYRIRGRRPWRRAGLLTIEVAGRRPLHLWVADIRALAAAVTVRC